MLREWKVIEQNYTHDLAAPNLHVRLLCRSFGSSVIMDLCPVCLEAGVEPCTECGRLYHASCIGQFLALAEQMIQDNQIPFRTELSVYSKGRNVAGQIDAIFKQADDTFVLWDWKRSKHLRVDNRSQMKEGLDHLPDVNAWHYFLQLNIYRHILQEDYGVPVSAMYLCIFHPSRSQPLCVRAYH